MAKNAPNITLSSEMLNQELKHVVSALREQTQSDYKVGQILFENRSYFDKDKLGSLLGSITSQQLLQGYLSQFNFKDVELGPLLKYFLEEGGFNLPQEREMIRNILEAFAHEYAEQNPNNKISSNPQDIMALIYGVLLLNTDLTSSDVREKMTEKEFVNNMLEIGDLKTLQSEIRIKEKKVSELTHKRAIDRDQKSEVQSLLIGYQERENQIKQAESQFKEIYQLIKANPLKITLSKDFKRERHHKKISRTLSLLLPVKHDKRVMENPRHVNKELKGSRPQK